MGAESQKSASRQERLPGREKAAAGARSAPNQPAPAAAPPGNADDRRWDTFADILRHHPRSAPHVLSDGKWHARGDGDQDVVAKTLTALSKALDES